MKSTSRSRPSVTNAGAALRWLGAQPPIWRRFGRRSRRILKDGNRAGDVIGRIRALIKKDASAEGSAGHQRSDPRSHCPDPRRTGEERRLAADELAEDLPLRPRRSSAAATSNPQLDHQCRRGDERRQRGVARFADRHGENRTACSSRCGIRVRGWTRRTSTASSRPSTRPSPVAWAWACRSAVRSSRLTEDDCGYLRMYLGAPSFNSLYLQAGPKPLPPSTLAKCRREVAGPRSETNPVPAARDIPAVIDCRSEMSANGMVRPCSYPAGE